LVLQVLVSQVLTVSALLLVLAELPRAMDSQPTVAAEKRKPGMDLLLKLLFEGLIRAMPLPPNAAAAAEKRKPGMDLLLKPLFEGLTRAMPLPPNAAAAAEKGKPGMDLLLKPLFEGSTLARAACEGKSTQSSTQKLENLLPPLQRFVESEVLPLAMLKPPVLPFLVLPLEMGSLLMFAAGASRLARA
jgi:hypothetical protein